MTEQSESAMPAHLKELLQPTPSGTAKLIAAWDGLPADTQIAILSAKKKHAGPLYLYHRVILKALSSENAFVRYLAARDLYLGDGVPLSVELKAKIESDPDPLVRFAGLERTSVSFDPVLMDVEKFCALPQEARLAIVRNLTDGGERVAALLATVADRKLKDGPVSETELFEILSDYLNKDEFKRHYGGEQLTYDGYSDYRRGKDIEALWELVVRVPERISGVIIENLPQQCGLSSGIPKHVLEAMTDEQLMLLLSREDIGLRELRKQKFYALAPSDDGKGNPDDKGLRFAATSHNFDLTNEEFASILARPDKPRVKDLSDLAIAGQDLRLCLLDAIHDALSVSNVGLSDFEYAANARHHFERKLPQLKGRQRDDQLLELKLYRLAVQATPWKQSAEAFPPSGDLAFLRDAIVEQDPWATFIGFLRNWREAGYQAKGFEKDLPIIWQAGEEAPPESDSRGA